MNRAPLLVSVLFIAAFVLPVTNIHAQVTNTVPVAVNDSPTVNQNTTATGNVLTNDSDANNDTLSVTGYQITGTGSTTFGKTSVGSTSSTESDATDFVATKFTTTNALSIQSISAYLKSTTGTVTVYVGIYKISGTNFVRVAQSSSGVSQGTTASWVTVPITASLTANTDYYLAVQANGHPWTYYSDSGSTNQTISFIMGSTGSFYTPFTTSSPEKYSRAVSIYATAAGTGTTSYTGGQSATVPNAGTVVINTNGSYSFTPTTGYSGNVPAIPYTITDGNGGTATANLSFSVVVPNSNPTPTNDTKTTNEDITTTGNVLTNDTDPNSDTLAVSQFVVNGSTYAVSSAARTIPNAGAFTLGASGAYAFVPNLNYNGTVPTITYTVTDGKGGSATATLIVTVTPVNDTPTPVNDTPSMNKGAVLSNNVLTNDTDVDGNTLTVTRFVVSGSTYTASSTSRTITAGKIVLNTNGSYTFTPNATFTGTVPTITYTVSDGITTATATLVITVLSPTNTAPVGTNDIATTAQTTTVSGNVLTNDSDANGDTLSVTQFVVNSTTYSASSTAQTISGKGTLSITTSGAYTFTPNGTFTGTVPTITYTVTDGKGGSATATLIVSVTANSVLKIMPLGDSITDGYNIPGGYREHLEELLVGDSVNYDFVGSGSNGSLTDKDHEGHSGYTVADIKGVVADNDVIQTYNPDVVLLMVGTNDINRGYSQTTSIESLGYLVDEILAADSGTIILIANIIPIGLNQWGSPSTTDVSNWSTAVQNFVSLRIADGDPVAFVNMNSQLSTSDLSTDGLHPNQGGYDKIGTTWFTALQAKGLID